MTEREKILARVREALSVKVAAGHAGNGADEAPETRGSPAEPRKWLPPVGGTFEERLAQFQRNATDLKAEFSVAVSQEDLGKRLAGLRDAGGWKLVAAHSGELVDPAVVSLSLPVCRTDKSYDVLELEKCDAAITECDALVAQTGSVLVTSRSAGGRGLSVLPPHHIVLARREQLVGDLPEAFALLKRKYGENYPSFISFITGPSRTGDIERILVLGAHGPKRLTVFLV